MYDTWYIEANKWEKKPSRWRVKIPLLFVEKEENEVIWHISTPTKEEEEEGGGWNVSIYFNRRRKKKFHI